jgi:hypothetical protein
MLTPPDMTRLAMRTLEDALAQAGHGPVSRQWGHRLALAWLGHIGVAEVWQCREFWTDMRLVNTRPGQVDQSRYLRMSRLTDFLDTWYRQLGWSLPSHTQRGRWADAYMPQVDTC